MHSGDVKHLSFWHDSMEDDFAPRPALPRNLDVDVAIVGGGYTGLWTAYYLGERDPSLRIAIIEKNVCGFGASGRNGGWVSAILPRSLDKLAKSSSRQAAIDMQVAMHHTVDEVLGVAAHEGIDCHAAKGGYLHLANNPAHLKRLHHEIEAWEAWGFGEEHHRFLDQDEATHELNVPGVLGATFTPHCAAIHPARLVRGLAGAVEARGVSIFEDTAVSQIDSVGSTNVVRTDHGDVRATVAVRATEGYTATLADHKRRIAPVYSLMIATEPLPSAFFDSVGWRQRQTFNDDRNLVIYGQRTADNRIAFGGRGAPYHFNSRIEPDFDRNAKVHTGLRDTLLQLFPALGDVNITHQWGGPLGIPRDWFPSCGFDPATGAAWAGGYVGDGVATTNLAGRTLASLITGQHDELTRLPWVNHRSRNWEPEPLRWLGINAGLQLPTLADRVEARTGNESRPLTWLLNKLVG
jgi:glycine/D-amino acid oxidase-like deaminating enzyme